MVSYGRSMRRVRPPAEEKGAWKEMYDPPVTREEQRSVEITGHSCEDCPLCRGAAAQQKDHYAVGRLRARIGKILQLDVFTTQQLDLRTLMEKWAEAGHPSLEKEK